MKLKAIKQRMNGLKAVHRVVESVQTSSMVTLTKLKRILPNAIATYTALDQLVASIYTPTSTSKTSHVFCTTDLKFCQNFLTDIKDTLDNFEMDDEDELTVFGTQCQGTSMPHKFTQLQNAFNADATSRVVVYSHIDGQFTGTTVWPYQPAIQSKKYICCESLDKNQVYRMYISAYTYALLLKHSIAENHKRIQSTTQAKNNAADMAKQLQMTYHKVRQNEITAELAMLMGGRT